MLAMKLPGDMPDDLKKAEALYCRAFPENERRPFSELVENPYGGTELFCFYDGETFVGMACLLNTAAFSHIIYFAVDETLRGHGYGSKMLELLHCSKPGKKFMADIERPDEAADNAGQRRRRKMFYLRAGYEETDIKYEWRHENYEVVSFGGRISEAEYDGFWKDLHNAAERGQ